MVTQLRLHFTADVTLLLTHHEMNVLLDIAGASQTAAVRDPRVLSPFEPRSAATAAFFCGRPTGSGYDGFAGAPHAAYVHHDMDHDRFVLRTFGRGGTRVDHRRRTGIGRSTYEAFCGAAPSAQVGTPLAPSPHTAGEANWQLDSAAALAWSGTGAFDFTVRRLATPAALESEAAAAEDFTRADQGIRTHYRRYTRDELLDRHAHMDFIYSYVNGSDITRSYIKAFAKSSLCSSGTVAMQLMWSELRRSRAGEDSSSAITWEDEFSRHVTKALFTLPTAPCSLVKLLGPSVTRSGPVRRLQESLERALRKDGQPYAEEEATLTGDPVTAMDVLRTLGMTVSNDNPDFIDADSDELRHSMRGLLQRTRAWHRGRLSVVTPYANVPQWLNQTTNFFLRSLLADVDAQRSGRPRRDAAAVLGTADYSYVREATTGQLHYSRMHVVDQRALMPPAPLTTVNSFAIEPFIYRLQNASGLFTFLNDDYLVLKDVDVMDFVNEHGGAILRLARPVALQEGPQLDSFRKTLLSNLYFTQRELDRVAPDLEELLQPSFFADSGSVRGAGENTSFQLSGVLRAEGGAFTAVIDATHIPRKLANSTLWNPKFDGPHVTTMEEGEVTTQALAAPRVTKVPYVALHGEPPWVADAAAAFHLVSASGTRHVLTGQVRLPRLDSWGERVLRRAAADIVAPQVRVGASAQSRSVHNAEVAAATEMRQRLLAHVSAVDEALFSVRTSPLNETAGPTAKLAYVLEDWRSAMAVVGFSTHHAMKVQPRLHKYRVRLESHAPFAQCRNMWNFIHTRYATDINLNMLSLHSRNKRDLLPPFTHTAHLLRHPWAASYRYLPFLMAKAAWRLQVDGSSAMDAEDGEPPVFPVMDVALDNEDGCAPATYIGEELGAAAYEEFDDSEEGNEKRMDRIRRYVGVIPFTNINSKFTKRGVGGVLRDFLEELFPTPMLLERHWQSSMDEAVGADGLRVSPDVEGGAGDDGTATLRYLRTAFQKLTRLPLIVVSNDEEGFCPVLRSLRHAMPAFRGLRVVQVLVPPADGRSLHAARAEQRHAYRNFLPVTRCTLPAGRLVRVALPANSSVADVVVAGLRGAREGLAERHWAAPALVALRGLRAERRAVQAVVVDARTLHGGAAGFTELSLALATPAELLAHEDFAEVLLDGDAYAAAQPLVRRPTEEEAAQPASAVYRGEQVPAAKPADYVGSVLVLSHADAASRHVHWAHGASEHDLLSGMPLPHEQVEDMTADVKWLF